MHKIAVYVAFVAAFVYYLTFAPPNKYLIDIEPIAYRLVKIYSLEF